MDTKILMIASSSLMAVCGIISQFFPREILHILNMDPDAIASLNIQMIGAMYLGFAMMNWMAKTTLIGGIYARPLAMGNTVHFTIGALALSKFAFAEPRLLVIWIAALIYATFAILFAVVLFTHPQQAKVTGGK